MIASRSRGKIMRKQVTREDVHKALEQYAAGFNQRMKGAVRRAHAEHFLEFMEPGARERLEAEIDSISGVRELNRFRTRVVLMLANAFQAGLNTAALMAASGHDVQQF